MRGSSSFFCSVIRTAACIASSLAFLAAAPRRTVFAFLAAGAGSSWSSLASANIAAAICASFSFLRRGRMFRTPLRIASLTAPSLYKACVCGREKESV